MAPFLPEDDVEDEEACREDDAQGPDHTYGRVGGDGHKLLLRQPGRGV